MSAVSNCWCSKLQEDIRIHPNWWSRQSYARSLEGGYRRFFIDKVAKLISSFIWITCFRSSKLGNLFMIVLCFHGLARTYLQNDHTLLSSRVGQLLYVTFPKSTFIGDHLGAVQTEAQLTRRGNLTVLLRSLKGDFIPKHFVRSKRFGLKPF